MDRNDENPYIYTPSLLLPILFSTLFALTSLFHSLQIGSTQQRYMILVTLGCLTCIAGNCLRVYSHYDPPSWTAYLSQRIVLLTTPSLLSLAQFIILKRILELFGKRSRIFSWKPGRIFLLLGFLEFTTLLVQGIGVGLIALAGQGQGGDRPNLTGPTKDDTIILIGMAVQFLNSLWFLLVLLFFVFKLILYKRRVQSMEVVREEYPYWTRRFHFFSLGLAMTNLLLLLRGVFRFLSLMQGRRGEMNVHKWYFYIFDQLPILLCALIFNVLHPGHVLPVRHGEAVSEGRLRRNETPSGSLPIPRIGGGITGTGDTPSSTALASEKEGFTKIASNRPRSSFFCGSADVPPAAGSSIVSFTCREIRNMAGEEQLHHRTKSSLSTFVDCQYSTVKGEKDLLYPDVHQDSRYNVDGVEQPDDLDVVCGEGSQWTPVPDTHHDGSSIHTHPIPHTQSRRNPSRNDWLLPPTAVFVQQPRTKSPGTPL